MIEEQTMTQGHKPYRGLINWVGTLLVPVALTACGGGGSDAHKALKPSAPDSPYGITAHVEVAGHPEQSGWVRVPPVDWQAWSSEAAVNARLSHAPNEKGGAPAPTTQSTTAPPRHVEATIQHGDGGVIDTANNDNTLNYAQGWTLLAWATSACFLPPETQGTTAAPAAMWDSLYVDTAPWRSFHPDDGTPDDNQLRDYYIFSAGGPPPDNQSCDVQLLMQETLLCAADHLAQLGDSPGTVTWSGSSGQSGHSPITVTIPPQRSDDIFIARDMALNALAHLLRLDTKQRFFSENTHTGFESTCIAQYATPNVNVPRVFSVTGSTYFDPVALTSSSTLADFQTAGKRRLTRKANLFVSAARLTKDLIERGVQDDISGAQQRLSAATDARDGARQAWGADADGSLSADPYNTLRHALRTLFGRLEIGNNADPRTSVSGTGDMDPFNGTGIIDWVPHEVTRDDPECSPFDLGHSLVGGGSNSLDAISILPSVSARWDDVPVKTRGQALALSVLDKAGIILPLNVVQAAGAASVRSGIGALLADDAAVSAGFSTVDANGTVTPLTTEFLTTDAGRALNQLFQSASDDDLSFALQRVYDAFRLITESAESSSSPAFTPTALTDIAHAAGLAVRDIPSISALGGIVLQGGLPRNELAVDPFAGLSRMQHLSSCGTFSHASGAPGALATTDLEAALGPSGEDVTAFQNPFFLAEGLRRQLASIAGAAASSTDVAQFSTLAAAEIRKWAGPGTLLTEDPQDDPETHQNLYLVNISPKDLGVDSLADLQERIVLVSSDLVDTSITANCVAGLRHSCPSGIEGVIRRMGSPPEYVDLSAGLSVGLDNQTIKLSFPYPTTRVAEGGSYAVLAPKDGKTGQVLGWLRTPTANAPFFAESYSNEQRELAAKVFGIGRATEPERSCGSVAPTTLSTDYCIAGMKRDQFVPLANELNSAGTSTSIDDSWRNYLDLAQAAADKADQLGVQLIQQGLDQDLRKESATETLGNLCGAFVSVDDVKAQGGDVTPPTGDAQLTECVGGATTDLVFLRDDLYGDLQDEATSKRIRDDLCPASSSTGGTGNSSSSDSSGIFAPPFCSKTSGIITHKGLNFHHSKVQPVSTHIADACGSIEHALSVSSGDTKVDLTNFGNAVAAPWATSGALGAALQNLQLDENPPVRQPPPSGALIEGPMDGEWTLSMSSRVIMGSDAWVRTYLSKESQADVWPFCTTLPAPPPPPPPPQGTPPPAPTDGCSDLANFVKATFSPLTNPSDPKHSDLRSYVESTLFYMGALAGQLPAGTIRMPVPVANRSQANLASATIPTAALYGESFFEPNGSDHGAPLYTITAKDAQGVDHSLDFVFHWRDAELGDMGFARALNGNSAYVASKKTSAAGLFQPAWRASLYDQVASSNSYLYVDATNARINFNPLLVRFTPLEFPLISGEGRDALAGWLTSRAGEFNSGASDFIDHVRQATYLTAVKANGDGTEGGITPYRYCRGQADAKVNDLQGPVDGRSVCVDAPVSPTFFVDYWSPRGPVVCGDFPEDINTTQDNRFFATINARQNSNTGGWFNPEVASGANFPDSEFEWQESRTVCPTGQTSASSLDEVNTACSSFDWHTSWGGGTRPIWHDRLKPSQCPPNQRLELFLDSELQDRVLAMQTLARTLSLSCASSHQNVGVHLTQLPPPISTVEDIDTLESWQKLLGYDVDQIANVLYLVDVPTSVVTMAQSGKSDVGAITEGERGKAILDLESKLDQLEQGFASLGTNLQQIADSIDKAKADIKSAQLQGNGQKLSIAAAKINNDRERNLANISLIAGVAKAAVAVAHVASVETFADSGAAAANELIAASEEIASANVDLAAAEATEANLVEQAKNATDSEKNQEAQAVIALSGATTGVYQAINDGITGLKVTNNAALADIDDLRLNAANATIALAKASGADFMKINGNSVPNHVNTVYRRQFDLTRQRYQLAIDGAKRTAYLARLSIEQRLGVRLDELHQNIGPLEPPATWVDDLCTVQGIDYSKLREATAGQSATSAAELDTIKGFANQFVGDYIDKLRQFVQFYNVQFPFVDSSDVAVVSLREDLPSSLAQCVGPSKNLLRYSNSLESSSPDISLPVMTSHNGWRVTQCASGTCLAVQDGNALVNTSSGGTRTLAAPPGSTGGASLLTTVAQGGFLGNSLDGGVAGSGNDAGASAAAPASPAPPVAVFQTVSLRAGSRYVLSWWDMARNNDGRPFTGSAKPSAYSVSIFDANWSLLVGDNFVPAAPADGTTWSDRRILEAFAAADGDYHVVFTVSTVGSLNNAVAIANVQLEASPGDVGGATAYESNQASNLHSTGRCTVDSPSQFRDRFQRRCDNTGCFFELRDGLAIDTQLLNENASSLIGKLAPGNFNYRNNTIAVNVVGTGVIDCGRGTATSCNGSAFVQYDLEHVAYNVPIDDHEGSTRCFDFGLGAVHSGKALASERFITLPMSSSDRDMINQSPFLKPEFSGRPLSGLYRLRIHDEPQLVWPNVDDIQIVMNYGYWSRVARSPGN